MFFKYNSNSAFSREFQIKAKVLLLPSIRFVIIYRLNHLNANTIKENFISLLFYFNWTWPAQTNDKTSTR